MGGAGKADFGRGVRVRGGDARPPACAGQGSTVGMSGQVRPPQQPSGSPQGGPGVCCLVRPPHCWPAGRPSGRRAGCGDRRPRTLSARSRPGPVRPGCSHDNPREQGLLLPFRLRNLKVLVWSPLTQNPLVAGTWGHGAPTVQSDLPDSAPEVCRPAPGYVRSGVLGVGGASPRRRRLPRRSRVAWPSGSTVAPASSPGGARSPARLPS